MALSVTVQFGAALTAGPPAGVESAATRRLLARAVRAAFRAAGPAAGEGEISVTLLADEEVAAMNEEFLGHAGPTDVISFALYDESEPVVGDVYVGLEQARRQAAANGVTLPEELVRLTVHGVLHVLGFDHPADEARLESEMWAVQERVVARVVGG
jgi:probable rRNA maturation factor